MKEIFQLTIRFTFFTLNIGDEYFQLAFGDRIDISAASSCLTQYLNESGLDGHINIVFSSDLDCRYDDNFSDMHVCLPMLSWKALKYF